MKRLKSGDNLDRLSELHESLIFLILSFVPMRDVVRTTILSKRWKDLCSNLPCLNFFELDTESVDSRNFINRALLLWKGTQIQRLKFTLGESFHESLYGDLDLWVRFAKERKVEELYIQLPYEKHMHLCYGDDQLPKPKCLPQCVYSCSSLTKLTLVGCNLRIGGSVHWHQLKSLKLHGYGFTHKFGFTETPINQLISSCPQLEILELRVFGSHRRLSFQSTSLKMLSIYTSDYFYASVLIISAPNLEELVISGAPYDKCLLTDVSSVTRVTLDLVEKWAQVHFLGETLRQILPTLHHVEAVTLSACCYKLLPVIAAKYSFSVPLMDVKFLRSSSGPIKPTEILAVLEIFPRLERLVIDWKLDADEAVLVEHVVKVHNIGVPLKFDEDMLKRFLTQMKRVEISRSFYEASMIEFIELVLKHGSVIGKIVIHIGRHDKVIKSEDMFLATQKMVRLQRSFPTVEIELCQN